MIFKGKIYDRLKVAKDFESKIGLDKYESIPNVRVYVSDMSGNITPSKIGAISDANGNFELKIPIKKVMNPVTSTPLFLPQIDGNAITARDTSTNEQITLPLSKTNIYNFDFATKSGLQKVKEAVVSGKDKLQCWKDGGLWDEATKTCGLPIPKHPVEEEKKPWWQRLTKSQKSGLLVGGLIVLTTTIVVIAKASKKSK